MFYADLPRLRRNWLPLPSILDSRERSIRMKRTLRATISFFCLMGIGWLFGVFQVGGATLLFQYIFSLFIVAQAVCIFMFNVGWDPEVRLWLNKVFAKIRRTSSNSSPRHGLIKRRQPPLEEHVRHNTVWNREPDSPLGSNLSSLATSTLPLGGRSPGPPTRRRIAPLSGGAGSINSSDSADSVDHATSTKSHYYPSSPLNPLSAPTMLGPATAMETGEKTTLTPLAI